MILTKGQRSNECVDLYGPSRHIAWKFPSTLSYPAHSFSSFLNLPQVLFNVLYPSFFDRPFLLMSKPSAFNTFMGIFCLVFPCYVSKYRFYIKSQSLNQYHCQQSEKARQPNNILKIGHLILV